MRLAPNFLRQVELAVEHVDTDDRVGAGNDRPCTALSPTPQPKMATLWPARKPAEFTTDPNLVVTEHPIKAASSSGKSGCTQTAAGSGTMMYGPYVAGP